MKILDFNLTYVSSEPNKYQIAAKAEITFKRHFWSGKETRTVFMFIEYNSWCFSNYEIIPSSGQKQLIKRFNDALAHRV